MLTADTSMVGQLPARNLLGVVSAEGKTRAQVIEAIERLVQRLPNVIVTHANAGLFGEVRNVCTEAEWHKTARVIRIWRGRKEFGLRKIAVIAARKTDIPVAEEAALTAETFGNRVERIWDAGNDETHRRQAELDSQNMQAIIVVGDGKSTLSLLARQIVGVPLVAVPTSSEYAEAATDPLPENFPAEVAKLTVVNLNDGVGAGLIAGQLVRTLSVREK